MPTLQVIWAMGALLCVCPSTSGALQAQSPRPVRLVEGGSLPRLVLAERFRLGGKDPESGFYRISDVTISPRTHRIVVADAGRHAVVVFDSSGKRLGQIGRDGDGPGESRALLKVAADAHDSVFVWDLSGGRVTVLAPDLTYAREFRLPAMWQVSSLRILGDGRLLATAYGIGDPGPVRIISRSGTVEASYGPQQEARGLEPFAGSLLGGVADVVDGRVVYAQKSPYEVWTFDSSAKAVARCVGPDDWTVAPKSVVRAGAGAAHLQWADYRHIARVMGLGDGYYLVQVLDPSSKRAQYDVIRGDCSGVRRGASDSRVRLVGRAGSLLVGIQELEYPEIVVYQYHLSP